MVWINEIYEDPAEGTKHLDRLIAALEEDGWLEKQCFDIRLAVEEALKNAERHGNNGDGKPVHFRAGKSSGRLYVSIKDQGNGFDPETVPDPTAPENLHEDNGRGVYLMREFMDEVNFSNNGEGHRVTMHKSKSLDLKEVARGQVRTMQDARQQVQRIGHILQWMEWEQHEILDVCFTLTNALQSALDSLKENEREFLPAHLVVCLGDQHVSFTVQAEKFDPDTVDLEESGMSRLTEGYMHNCLTVIYKCSTKKKNFKESSC